MNTTSHHAILAQNAGWGLGTSILVLLFGSFGIFLVISYIVHWVQVTKLIMVNRRAREEESLERQPSRSVTVSIRALETQTTTCMDMGTICRMNMGLGLIRSGFSELVKTHSKLANVEMRICCKMF